MRMIVVLLLGALLAACQATQPPPAAPAPVAPPAVDAQSRMLAEWLHAADGALQLSAAQARAQLAARTSEATTPEERFQVALLHQQVGEWGSLVLARDTMRALHGDDGLPPDVRRLAGLLESFSQARINAQQQRTALRKAVDEQAALLATTQQQVQALEEKIRTLMSLEDSMQQRREEQGATP